MQMSPTTKTGQIWNEFRKKKLTPEVNIPTQDFLSNQELAKSDLPLGIFTEEEGVAFYNDVDFFLNNPDYCFL